MPIKNATVAKLRKLGADTADVAIIATTLDGAVFYWNEAASRLYGWPSDEARGRNILELTPALQARELAAAVMEQLCKGRSWSGEIALRRQDGGPFSAFVVDVPAPFGAPDPQVIVGVSAELARKAKVLRQSARLEIELVSLQSLSGSDGNT